MRRLVFTLAASGGALLALEGAARLAEPGFFPSNRTIPTASPHIAEKMAFIKRTRSDRERVARAIPMVADKDRGWVLPPGRTVLGQDYVIVTNSLGIRGVELAEKAANEVRLLSLGDSSVFGDGVEEESVFTSIAARALSPVWGVPVTQVIGATPGHDSTQSLATLRAIGAAAQPDWIVVGNLWSDVYRGDRGSDPFEEQGYYPAREVARRWALYRIAWRSLGPWLATREVHFMASRADIGGSGGVVTRTPLARYQANQRAMVVVAGGLHASVAFVAFPAPMDLENVPPPDTVIQFRAAMRLVAEESHAPFVDGPDYFREKGATLGFFDDQVHPNAEGHALLGYALAAALVERHGVAGSELRKNAE